MKLLRNMCILSLLFLSFFRLKEKVLLLQIFSYQLKNKASDTVYLLFLSLRKL